MADSKVTIVEDISEKVIDGIELACLRILYIIGGKIEKYAKALCPVGTPESTGKKGYRGGTLRDSIAHVVDEGDFEVTVGSNVEYAPYVELGTGPYFTPPPEWEQFNSPRGKGVGHGYVKPRPYLRPAVENHISEFKDIVVSEVNKALK